MAVSLIDIGPLNKEVTLRGHKLTVHGMPALQLFELLKENTAVRRVLAERAVDADIAEQLINSAPQFVAQCIAAAMGKMGDEATIGFAMTQLSAGETEIILSAAIELTFPQGVATFVAGLKALSPAAAPSAPSGKEADTK